MHVTWHHILQKSVIKSNISRSASTLQPHSELPRAKKGGTTWIPIRLCKSYSLVSILIVSLYWTLEYAWFRICSGSQVKWFETNFFLSKLVMFYATFKFNVSYFHHWKDLWCEDFWIVTGRTFAWMGPSLEYKLINSNNLSFVIEWYQTEKFKIFSFRGCDAMSKIVEDEKNCLLIVIYK